MAGYRYKAFISYSHADEKWARWLHKNLEGYRIPKRTAREHGLLTRRLTPIFRDRDELASSSDLSTTIVDALSDSESLVVVCSPNAAQSRWVNQEIEQFSRLRDPARIFCLLVDRPELSFPPALIKHGAEEPLAADAREHADGKRGARLKLIASLLDIPYDALRQREARRRAQRLIGVAAGSASGMVLTTALATFAFLAQREADEQRDVARAEAETAQNVSDFLVGMFKVTDPNESDGELVTARALLDRGLDTIASLSDEPEVQLRLTGTMGDVYANLGLYDEALRLARSGLTIALELGDEHAAIRAEIDIALIESASGNVRDAKTSAQSALERARAIDDLALMADAHGTLGRVLGFQDEHIAARREAATAVELTAAVYGPDSPKLAYPLNNLAIADWYLGEMDAARRTYERVLQILRQEHGESHFRVAGALNNLAIVFDQKGDYAEAVALHERALEIRRRVLAPDHPDISESLSNMGTSLRSMGEVTRAIEVLSEALDMRRAKYRSHPAVAATLTNLGQAYIDSDQFSMARPVLEEAIAMFEGTSGATHSDVAFPLYCLAQVEREAGRIDVARALIERALALREAGLGANHYLMLEPLRTLIEIEDAAGEVERANQLRARVSAIEEQQKALTASNDTSG